MANRTTLQMLQVFYDLYRQNWKHFEYSAVENNGNLEQTAVFSLLRHKNKWAGDPCLLLSKVKLGGNIFKFL